MTAAQSSRRRNWRQKPLSITAFVRTVKLRQHVFRDESGTVSDDGRNPRDEKGQRNPNLLALGHEKENLYPSIRGTEGAVEFFAHRKIKWWKSSRSGDNTGTEGPTRNMASSQVACVNFLLPLADIPGALSAALWALDKDVRTVVGIYHQGRISPVEFEWLGIPRSLEGGATRGALNTSVDAFLVAQTITGHRRAYLIEWKYAEQYQSTRPAFKGDGKSGNTRRTRYNRLFHAHYSAFSPDAVPELDDFLYEPFYQIMRQRLLADRMVRERELDVDEARVVVVVPEENFAYRAVNLDRTVTLPLLARRFPGLDTVEGVMRASLRDPDAQFRMVTPALLLDGVVRSLPDETVEWARYWKERYGV